MKLAMLIFAAVVFGLAFAVIHSARRMRAVPEDTCEHHHSQCVGVNNGTMNQTNQ